MNKQCAAYKNHTTFNFVHNKAIRRPVKRDIIRVATNIEPLIVTQVLKKNFGHIIKKNSINTLQAAAHKNHAIFNFV